MGFWSLKSDDKGSDKPVPKSSLERWLKGVAANDKKYGRDSKDNPNNKPNGKWLW